MPSQIPLPERVSLPLPPQYDPHAPTQLPQQPSFPTPLDPLWSPAPTMNAPEQAGRFPPTVRDVGVPPMPGAPDRPPRKRRIGLLTLIGVALVVVVVAVVGYFALGLGSTTATLPCSLGGYTAFTSPDHTFCLDYPTGWQVMNPSRGSGAQFSGPAHQVFTAANLGAYSGTAAGFDRAVCLNLGGIAGLPITLTLAGQTWTQRLCFLDADHYRTIIESSVYQGKLYHMDYGSATLTFLSNRSQFFTPMEQSFRFL